MTKLGVDFAWGRVAGRVLRQVGFQFVCRYLSHDATKNLTKDEAADLHGAGIAIVLVWESAGRRALLGRSAGEEDARAAQAEADQLGVPSGVPIYFAVDFDPLGSQMPSIVDYFRGVRAVLGYQRTGIYGAYHVVANIQGLHARYGWQTYAWSGNSLSPAAHIYQFSNGHRVAGVSVDFNRAEHADYGAWEPSHHERRQAPHGIARFAGGIDLADGHWTVHGAPNLRRVQLGAGGTGGWEIEPLAAEGDWWCAKLRIHRGR